MNIFFFWGGGGGMNILWIPFWGQSHNFTLFRGHFYACKRP